MIKTGEKMELREQEHNYELVEIEDGFEIIPIESHRPSVKAHLLPSGFWGIEHEKSHLEEHTSIFSPSTRARNDINLYIPGDTTSHIYKSLYPLFSFSTLLNEMVSLLYETWTKTDGHVEIHKKNDSFSKEVSKSEIVCRWAIKTTVKTLAKKASVLAKEKHAILNPDIVTLHRLLYSEAGGAGWWDNIYSILQEPDENKYLIKDLINFKSARCFFLNGLKGFGVDPFGDKESTFYNRNYWKTFDWKKELGDVNNCFVRKTISNYPKGVPYYMISTLYRMKNYGMVLREPITTRIRMMVYYYISHIEGAYAVTLSNIIKKSTDEEIKKAVRMCADDHHIKPDLRKIGNINTLLHYIFDYVVATDNISNSNIIKIYKKSKKYHDDLNREENRYMLEQLSKKEEYLEKETKLPAIELPNDKNVRFLRTVADIYKEGSEMGHCVASYADYAVSGLSHLFHIEYEGEYATAEVDMRGNVIQVRGPQNISNSAVIYGDKILKKWGRKLKKEVTANIEHVDFVPQELEYDGIPF